MPMGLLILPSPLLFFGGGGWCAPPPPARANALTLQKNDRSVAIDPVTQNQKTRLVEYPQRKVQPSDGGIRAGFLQSSELHNDMLIGKRPPLPKQVIPVKFPSESSLDQRWNVDNASLPRRPSDFPPLTRTHRVVRDVDANVISNRITECLQSRSIKTRFSKTRNNIAKCRNTDFCKFTVSLYAGNEGGVLVEIHRLCGDVISFVRDSRAVLDAAEDKAVMGEKDDETPMFLQLPVSNMSCLKDARLPEVTVEMQVETVNVTANLLSSIQIDANMLGMESLVILTDPEKTHKSTAILASRSIICPDHDANRQFSIHNYVMSLLIYDDDCVAPSSEDSSSIHDEGTSISDFATRLRNLAMSALSNAIGLLSQEGLLSPDIAPHREWYMSVLLPRLIGDLNAADLRPHDACYASRCLSTLAESSIDFAAKFSAIGGFDAVKNAEKVGVREFALLQQDAGRCHEVLREANLRCCVK
jgi:hypothetical protein